MKFSYATVFTLLVTTAYSQTVLELEAQIPACGFTCLSSAAVNVGCGPTDAVCVCGTNREALAKIATPCIVKGCSTAEALSTQNISTQICALLSSGSSSLSSSATSSILSKSKSTSISSTTSSSTTITSASSIVTAKATANSTSGVASTTGSSPTSTSSSAVPVSASSGSGLESIAAAIAAVVVAAFAL
ncbi:hypothetical protein B0J14DRAFT_33386 [Halenospora varia]|nr:hypothetical protein B0J14DRAFT_33386 [Halenospora varia]